MTHVVSRLGFGGGENDRDNCFENGTTGRGSLGNLDRYKKDIERLGESKRRRRYVVVYTRLGIRALISKLDRFCFHLQNFV